MSSNAPEEDGPTERVDQPVSLRRFLSDTVVYGLVDVSDKAIGFLLLPITTYMLSPDDYGLLNIFGASAGVLFLLFSVGMLNGFFRFYTASDDARLQRRILSTAIWTVAVSTVFWSALMFVAASQLDRWLFRGDGTGYVVMLALASFLQILESMNSARLQADGRAWIYVLVNVFRALLTRGISVGLIIAGYGAWGWIVGEVLGLAIALGFMFATGLKGIRFEYDRDSAREMVPYSASLVPAAMSHWVMTSCDAYLLKFLGALSDVGMYGVGQRISSIMQLINTAFILGWRRFAFKNIHHPDGPRLLARGVTLFAVGGGFGALALSLLGDDLTYWAVAPKFREGIVVIAPLTLATFVWGLSDIVAIGLHKAKRTLLLSWLNVLAAAANIGFNFALIPRYGILGAALGTFAAQVLKTALVWRASQAAFPIPFETRRLALAAGVFFALFLLGDYGGSWMIDAWAGNPGWIAAGGFQSALLLAAPAILWKCGFFEPEERSLLRSLAGGWRGWFGLRNAPRPGRNRRNL